MSGNEFRFFLSCDINLPVTFRIESLDGDTPVRPPAETTNGTVNSTLELYVECALYIDGVLFGLPTRTRFCNT